MQAAGSWKPEEVEAKEITPLPPPMPAPSDPQPEQRLQTACLLLISAVLSGAALYWLKGVMIPFVLALFVALGLSPFVEAQMRWLKLPKAIAILVTLVIGGAVLSIVVSIVSTSVQQLAANASLYQSGLRELLTEVAAIIPLDRLGVKEESLHTVFTEIPVSTVSGLLFGITNTLLELLSQATLVSIFAMYLLIGLTGRNRATAGFWADAEGRVKTYLLAKTAISVVTGVLAGTVLYLLGVELALVFGLFACLLNFIPTVGSIVATLLPLPIILMNPEVSLATGVLAIALPGAIHFVVGNIVEPQVLGDSLALHPVTIMLALMVWGVMWGIPGMLLAAPITAVMKIIFERTERTRPLAHALAGDLGSS